MTSILWSDLKNRRFATSSCQMPRRLLPFQKVRFVAQLAEGHTRPPLAMLKSHRSRRLRRVTDISNGLLTPSYSLEPRGGCARCDGSGHPPVLHKAALSRTLRMSRVTLNVFVWKKRYYIHAFIQETSIFCANRWTGIIRRAK